MSHGPAGAILLALALLVATANAQGELGPWSAEAGFTLELPAGWSVQQEVRGHGAALHGPQQGAWPVDLVVWRVGVGVVNVADAAAEHERLLGSRTAYERSRLEPISTSGAGDGAFVEGRVTLPDGQEAASLFAVFLRAGRGYVVGTFADPAGVLAARKAYLDPVVEGLSLVPDLPQSEPSEDRRPAPPPEPGLQPEPPLAADPPSGGQPAGTGPVAGGDTGVAGSGSPELPSTRSTHSAGFSISLPRGWRCEVSGGVARTTSPDGVVAYLLPFLCTGQNMGTVTAEDGVGRCLVETENARLVSCRMCGRTRGLVRLWVGAALAGVPVSGPFAMVIDGSAGLLAGVLSPEGDREQRLRVGAAVIASLDGDLVGALPPPARAQGASWTDRSGAIECTAPAGWRLGGTVSRYDGMPVIHIQGSAIDGGRAWFAWHQPVRPVFRDLTEAMRGLGFRDGDPYYAYDGVDRRMVMTRGSPADLVSRYLLPEGLILGESAKIVGGCEPPQSVGLLGSADEMSGFVSLTDGWGAGAQQGWCAISQRTTQPSRGGWFWEAAYLSFGGDIGEGRGAGQALETVIRSARPFADSNAETAAGVEESLDRAVAACRAPLWQEMVGDMSIAPVLERMHPAPGEEMPYAVPAAARALWEDVGNGTVKPCSELDVSVMPEQPGLSVGPPGGSSGEKTR